MKKKRKKRKRSDKPKALKSWLMSRLRRMHMYWPESNECIKRARVGPDQYKCEHCEGIYPKRELERDHEFDVIDPIDSNLLESGEFDWHKTITRMFTTRENYTALCKGCHIIKTWLSRQLRENNRVGFEWEYLFEEDEKKQT